jgi:hypothetical protein
MNAKKLLSVLVLASAGFGLVACGTASSSKAADSASNTAQPAATTRAQALTALDKIAANVSATSYVKSTSIKISVVDAQKAAVSTAEYDVAANFGHMVYVVDVKDKKSGNVTVAAGTEVWGYKGTDNKFYVVEKVGTTITNWSADADFGVADRIAGKITSNVGNAAFMAKYIRGFYLTDPTPNPTLATGGTQSLAGKAVMKAESYTVGTNAVTLDITPRYYDTYDEHMVYTYTDNLIRSIVNEHTPATTTYSWGAAVTATLPTDTGTAVADATAGAALLNLL